MIVTEEQKKEIKKYGVDIDKLIKNGDVNEVRIKRDSNENHSLKEPLLLVHFKSFRYSDGEQPFCL